MVPFEFLASAARRWPDRIAAASGTRSLTFAALAAEASAIGAGYRTLTGEAQPRIALLSPNSLDLLVAIMGVHACGGVLVPLNPRNAKPELAAQIETAAPHLLLVDPRYADLASSYGGPRVALNAGDGAGSTHELARRHAGAAALAGLDIAAPNAIKFTGGSSGKPKAVLQSFRSLTTLVANMLITFGFDADDRYLVAAPMTHGAGQFMLPILAAGGRVVIPTDASAEGLVQQMVAEPITTTWVPPTLLFNMTDAAEAEGMVFPALKHLIYGGAACPPEKIRKAQAVFGATIEVVYGQTEASTIATAMRAADMVDDRNLASVGPAAPLTSVRIRAADGSFLPAGEMGEIVIGGDLVMNGYLGMPEVTAQTIRDGWLHTGDVGYLDERGYLYIKDRIRDVVITGGFNVYPSDVEAALAKHPAIHDAIVFGLPDAKWGERVEAAVQLKPGQATTEEELVAFAKEALGSVKAPKHIHIVADLPRSPVGKVLRRDVKAMFGTHTAAN